MYRVWKSTHALQNPFYLSCVGLFSAIKDEIG